MLDTSDLPVFREHERITDTISEDHFRYKQQPNDGDITKVWAFGLVPGGQLSYYIGVDWIDPESKLAIFVRPKQYNDDNELDYQKMFMECLNSPVTMPYLGDAYDIRIDSPFIEVKNDDFDFSPFLAHHFLSLLKDLVKRPLKKGYVQREENLTAKIKGKVLMGSHIKKNILGMRPDRVMCRYQEYSVDCIENRLLHTAYKIAIDYLKTIHANTAKGLGKISPYDAVKSHFHCIGYITHQYELHGIKSNPLYREYAEAIRLAKLIYRNQGYRNTQRDRKRFVPPYIIDMSKLFELYAYVQLSKIPGTDLTYQSKGKYGYTDFLDIRNKIVIDAKYKYQYDDSYEADDIRQIAGYARDIGILEKLRVSSEDRDEVVDCMVIYPSKRMPQDLATQYLKRKDLKETRIRQFHRYYKIGIQLPEVQMCT
jgi:5-methylcytosine-specific restriction enzyme subunit McrC